MKKFLLSSVLFLFVSLVMVTNTNAQCATVLSSPGFLPLVDGTNNTVTYSFTAVFNNGNPSITVKFYCPGGTLLATRCYNENGGTTKAYIETLPINGCNPAGQYYLTAQSYTNNSCGGNACGNLITLPETANSSLPVTLINFNAAQKNNKVSLTWETTFEQANRGFDVERRMGNGTYEKIGFVASKEINGNGGGNTYSFEDNTMLSKGVSYYRLRQVDYDGRVAFSEVKAIRTGNGSIVLSVYPNPSRGTTNVAIPAGVGSVDVSVDDFTGKSVQRFSGLNTQNLQLTNLKPGMYMLRVSIRATGETITERIAVQ